MSPSSNRKKRPASGRPGGGRPSTPPGTGKPPKGGRPAEGPPVVGKRPSNPTFLALVGLLWIAAAIGALLVLHRSWKLIPVVCFAGVGLLYLRGAAGAYLRRDSSPGPKA